MIHPVLDQAALHHQAVQVVLTALPTNQKITMESLVKVCLHFVKTTWCYLLFIRLYVFFFVSADHSRATAAHHKSHKSVNDSGYAYYHEPEHGKK